jgi:hypothetical protein
LLRSPYLCLPAAEHLDVALGPRPLTELSGLGRDEELGQARFVRLDLGQRLAFGRLTLPDLDGAFRRRAAVGIDGGGENAILHVRNQAAAFRDQADLNRLSADWIGARDGLAVVGRVGDLRLQFDQGVAFVERLTDEVIGQLDVELHMALRVGFALPGLEVLEGHVKRAGGHFHLAAGRRLAEKVIDLQIGLDRFLG